MIHPKRGIEHFFSKKIDPKTSQKLLPFLIGFLIASSILIYLKTTFYHAVHVNTNPLLVDQSAYIDLVKKTYETKFRFLGDRNRMPLYVFLQTLFYSPNMSLNEYFLIGKYANILLSLVLLFIIFKYIRTHFKDLPAVVFTLIITFSLFITKAAYFQTEILFYTLSFLAFFYYIKWFTSKINGGTAFITGLITGLAYMSKATILSGFFLWLFIQLIRIISSNIKRNLLSIHIYKNILLCVFGFLLVTGVYLIDNYKTFGRLFYNVGTNYYVWMDSWNQAKANYSVYGHHPIYWPITPSLSLYLHTHTLSQIIDRFIVGLQIELYSLTFLTYPSAVFRFFWFYFVSTIILLLFNRNRWTIKKLLKKYFFLVIFIVVFFGSYLLSFAWYLPLVSFVGNRMYFFLFLPALYLIFLLFENITIKQYRIRQVIHITALILLFINFFLILRPMLAVYNLGD